MNQRNTITPESYDKKINLHVRWQQLIQLDKSQNDRISQYLTEIIIKRIIH